MNPDIVLVESCQGFWSCIDANTVMTSLITLVGIFASALLTYHFTSKQHKNDIIVNHKDFYSTVGGLDTWITNLTKRLVIFETINNTENLKDEIDTLELLAKEVMDSIEFDDVPYPLRRPLFNILQLTLQIRGYSIKLIERIAPGNEETVNFSEIQKKYKYMNDELKKNHTIIKKYI